MLLLSFLEERDLPRRGREARAWLTTDERGRVVGLVIASVAVSLLASLLATALVGFVERRRAASADGAAVQSPDEAAAEPEGVDVPAMEAAAVPEAEPTSA